MTAPPRAPAPDGGFGIYVHWPFCAAKCPYCDFNSHVRRSVDEAAWARALCTELRTEAARLDARPVVQSVFFGGGTPSLMAGSTVADVLDTIGALFPLAPDLEVTLEANPTSADAERFRAYRAAGVNRVSLGVQALDDAALKALGRWHTAAEALQAVDLAGDLFARVSFDLIYARPGQTPQAWTQELASALARGPEHLSLYQLTIEEGTPFAALAARGQLVVPDDDMAATLYAETAAQCAAAGLPAYEISNHARPGAESRHNLVYWRYGDYLGIGPGAHGRVTVGGERRATAARRSPEAWMAAVASGGTGRETDDPVPAADQAREYLVMALRLAEGASLSRHAALAGTPLPPDRIAALAGLGLLERAGDRLVITPQGRPVLNRVIAELSD